MVNAKFLNNENAMLATKKYIDELTYEINSAMIEVHRHLGPGLLESVYQKCLKYEFKLRGIGHKSEVFIPIEYKEMPEEIDFRCDFLVGDIIIIELKAVSDISPISKAQLLNYMKLMAAPKGILVNFNVAVLMRDGYKTFVNEHYANLPFK
jgi:GxxExxY protein